MPTVFGVCLVKMSIASTHPDPRGMLGELFTSASDCKNPSLNRIPGLNLVLDRFTLGLFIGGCDVRIRSYPMVASHCLSEMARILE